MLVEMAARSQLFLLKAMIYTVYGFRNQGKKGDFLLSFPFFLTPGRAMMSNGLAQLRLSPILFISGKSTR
jgi:hypothetical protein